MRHYPAPSPSPRTPPRLSKQWPLLCFFRYSLHHPGLRTSFSSATPEPAAAAVQGPATRLPDDVNRGKIRESSSVYLCLSSSAAPLAAVHHPLAIITSLFSPLSLRRLPFAPSLIHSFPSSPFFPVPSLPSCLPAGPDINNASPFNYLLFISILHLSSPFPATPVTKFVSRLPPSTCFIPRHFLSPFSAIFPSPISLRRTSPTLAWLV